MSNWSQIQQVIIRVLSDYEEHTFSELKAAVEASDSAELPSKNTLSAVLYQMMKSDCRLIRTGKATYQYRTLSKSDAAKESFADLDAVIEQMNILLNDLDSKIIRKPTYEMSIQEFEHQKAANQLSKSLHTSLDAYKIMQKE